MDITLDCIKLRADKRLDELSDGYHLSYEKVGLFSAVEATGPIDFVSEIAEQLGWLASTLRTSPVPNGIVTCTPKIANLQMNNYGRLTPGLAIVASCRMDFPMTRISQDTISGSPGSCWVNLFRNPILVTGYPIRRRSATDTGIDMSLHIMAELLQSRQVTLIDDRVIIKGFCSLLVSTAISADMVLWHLLFEPSGERISYCDPKLDKVGYEKSSQDFTLRDLVSRRHIVGWCSNIREFSGKRALCPYWTFLTYVIKAAKVRTCQSSLPIFQGLPTRWPSRNYTSKAGVARSVE